MQNSLTMHIHAPFNDLPHNFEAFIFRNLPFLLEMVLECATLTILSDDHELLGLIILPCDEPKQKFM